MENRAIVSRYQWLIAGALIGLFCATAQARTIKLRVVLDSCFRSPKTLSIVMNNNENAEPQLKPDDDTHGSWTGEWKDEREGRQFPEAPLCASLRLGGSRTDCKFAERDEDSHGVFIAVYTFVCDENAVRQVTITTEVTATSESQMHVSYVRTLRGEKACIEHGDFSEKGIVRDLRFPSETLLLQLDRKTPDVDGPGLRVFDSSVKNAGARAPMVVDQAIRKSAQPCADDRTALCLRRDDVVAALEAQRLRANPNSYTNAGKTLEALGLERLKLKVE